MYGLASTANNKRGTGASAEENSMLPLTAELAQMSEFKSHLAEGFSSVGGGQTADGDGYENEGSTATLSHPKSQIRALPFRRQSAY